MKVLFMLTRSIISNVCFENDFYTAGSNEDYEKMFSMATENGETMEAEAVAKIAEDIVAHSTKDVKEMLM